jgi:hypothetical protein
MARESVLKTVHETTNIDDIGKKNIGLGPATTNFIRNLLNKLNNEQKNTITHNLIEPVMDIINQKIKPYIYISIGMYLLIVILLLFLIYLTMKKKN